MCTVLTTPQTPLVGRTMDFPFRSPWKLTYLPPNYCWQPATGAKSFINRYAILGGMRQVAGHYLIGDGINEAGLFCAELFFPVAAKYEQQQAGRLALTPQDLIAWLLGQCATVAEVVARLERVRVIEAPWFDHQVYPFHWFLKDQTTSIVIEPLAGKLVVLDNQAGVLTNTPSYHDQIHALNQSLGITQAEFSFQTQNRLRWRSTKFTGDNSIQRFQRAAEIAWQQRPSSLNQMQLQLNTLAIPKGPRHRHNYTHYQAAIDCQRQQYDFYDCQLHTRIKKELPVLVSKLAAPVRF